MPKDTELSIIKNSDDATMPEIQNLIYVIRGKQVMIDSDLAKLYQVETRVFNQAVKRNIDRFPDSFHFQITETEFESLRSQLVISSGMGGRRHLPYVFTEQGIAMLSAILRSNVAVQISIRIMETFVEMRKYLANSSLLLDKVNTIEARQIESELRREAFEDKTDRRFEQVFEYISAHEESTQKIFYDGQIFDAFNLMTDLMQKADKSIILIDGYSDMETLNILAKKKKGVSVLIYTFPNTRLTARDIAKFNAQYPKLKVKHTTAFHDRFLVLDDINGYHIGASIKDAGKKCFGINKIEDVDVIKGILQRADSTS